MQSQVESVRIQSIATTTQRMLDEEFEDIDALLRKADASIGKMGNLDG